MAKRFTDTAKWEKASFCKLSAKLKLVWIYLCDRCDHAGFWDVNLPLLSFQIGEEVTSDDLYAFGDKLSWVSPSKVWIGSFVDFQYGELREENRAHASVLNRLKKEGAWKGLTSPIQGAKDKDKDKDKDKVKEKEKEKDKDGEYVETTEAVTYSIPHLAKLWNQFCGNLPKVRGVNGTRKRLAETRWRENPSTEYWSEIIEKIAASEFCSGRNDRGWRASFDFLIRPETQHKVLEGKYDSVSPGASYDWSKVFGDGEGAA